MSIKVCYFIIECIEVNNCQDWTSWTSSSSKNPSSWDLPDFNRKLDINNYRPPPIPDINQTIQNNPTWNRPV